jgi:glucokinase
MLEINEFLVLDYVRDHDPTTRTDIARHLGLSAASVSRIVGRLRRDGLIVETGTLRSPGGRPRTVVSFRRDAGAVLAVDLGGTRCHAVLADLAGTVLEEDLRPTRSEGDAFATLAATIDTMRAAADRRAVPMDALAVGVPGIVDPAAGTVRDAPYVGWEGFPLVDRLAGIVDVPFVVDNDVNLAALAHAWRGDGRRVDDFVVLSLGTGSGAAIVSGGRLLQGHNNVAGEIGYLIVRPQMLGWRIRDGLGAFESIASGPGIAARARVLQADGRPSSLTDREIVPEAVVEAAGAGDELARSVIDELLDDLAMVVIAFVCTVDPEVIILEGGLGRTLGPYLDDLVGRVEPSVPSLPRVVISSLGREATVLGAVAAALELARRRAAPAVVQSTFSVGGVARHAS